MRFRARCTTCDKNKLKNKETLLTSVVFSCAIQSHFLQQLAQRSISGVHSHWYKSFQWFKWALDQGHWHQMFFRVQSSWRRKSENNMRLRTDWKGPIASGKVCKIKKKNTRKLFKETAVTGKMEVRRTADVCGKLKWRWFQMTRGRSNKAWEVDWRKNCKSCKHLPFIQFHLNSHELGLSEVSVRNFKQYLKHRIRLFRIFPSVSYPTQRTVPSYAEESLH